MKLSNRLYDIFKYVATIVLPALATFYFALSEIWGLPFGGEIVATITALDTFLGVLLGISSARYQADKALYEVRGSRENTP